MDDINTEEVQDQQQEKLDENLIRCPCCGKITLRKPIKPGHELLDHWLACISTGVPFSHTYPMYGGKVLITATSPDTDTEVNITAAITAVERAETDGEYSGLSATALRTLANAIHLFSVVREIVFVGPPEKRFDAGAAAAQAISELSEALSDMRAGKPASEWSEHLQTAYNIMDNKNNVSALPTNVLIAVGRTHAQLSDVLMSAGFDEDFWQGIELV